MKDDILDKAIEIREQAMELTDEQLLQLHDDEQLCESVRLLHSAAIAAGSQAEGRRVDVEERLRMLHDKVGADMPSCEAASPLSENRWGSENNQASHKFFRRRHSESGRAEHTSRDSSGRIQLDGLRMNMRWILTALSATAMIVGVLFLLGRGKSESQLPEGTVFLADNRNVGITLTTEHGDTLVGKRQSVRPGAYNSFTFDEELAQVSGTEKLTLDIPYGSTADFTLPDGTVVYLHPGARIVFPNRFVGACREVEFSGEAYFDVAKDEEHPFVIVSDNMHTTVLGTEFNLNTKIGNVVLVSGSVSLSDAEGHSSVTLKPHQQATLSADNGTWNVTACDTTPYEFWRDGYLYFENASLKDIMAAIGQNFNMSVVFRNKDAMAYRMRFITRRDNGVEAAVKTMNDMKKVTVSIKAGSIYID